MSKHRGTGQQQTKRQSKRALKPQSGFSLLEFALVVMILAAVVYAILPSIGGSLKFAHETVVRQTAVAFRDSLTLVAAKHQLIAHTANRTVHTGHLAQFIDVAGFGNGSLDLNEQGYPIGSDWQAAEQRPLQTRDCLSLWYGLLGGLPPSAAIVGEADFRVQTLFDAQRGLGCSYRYLRAGEMTIRYFPDTGEVNADVQF
ncbi:hypothetical protein HPT27_09665 [Permianibacter sp. IMCC34836]|uniref:type II secretion system protein n=1 Tax=Permianibacter fluminis TaxID=2738515 RepID=UPI001551F398|nr:hypothetical protein [Permianibacter fluminis]NQD37294.1 hypothetical protein [Permianibacter fluminis]